MSRRSGLGKGLDALIPGGVDGAERERGQAPGNGSSAINSVLSVRIEQVVPNTHQPRKQFEAASLQGLADSIRELGILQPLIVRPHEVDGYELIAGERRLRAARLAGLTEVPVIVRRTADVESLEQAIVENLHREDLNALEEAAALRELIDEFGYTQDQAARRVGRSRSAVANLLRLLHLPPEVQAMVRDGGISAGHARAILSVEDAVSQVSLARRIATEGLSVRDAEDAARLRSQLQGKVRSAAKRSAGSEGRPDTVANSDRPAGVLELEELLSETLSTRVAVELTAKHGRISIEFADLDDLERIYRMIVEE